MKLKVYFSFVLLICINLSINAQLKVLQNGRVQAGLVKDADDLNDATSMQIFGKTGAMRTGSKLSFGDFGRFENNGWNVFLGEYGTADSDQLWLHGKLGIYLTTSGNAMNVVACYNPSVNSNFVFNTNLRVNGINISSDARLKENIKPIQNPLNMLSLVNGVSYTYSLSAIKEARKQDESKFASDATVATPQAGVDNTVNTATSDFASSADTAEKTNRDKQVQAETDRKEAADANRKRIGFLAQDIQKVLPELVQTDENGMMSIDYIGFIPLIVESIKEMQNTIAEQNEQIKYLSDKLGLETKGLRSSTTSNEEINMDGNGKLFNADGASVKYSLPAGCTQADLQIFDITGKIVKEIKLNTAADFADIHNSETGFGTFVYTLLVDGRKADTLKKYVSR
jgi:hypothetical protein